jgi:3-phenylpropionate/trans-cinnamate dioxygenase ferredoxin subunit
MMSGEVDAAAYVAAAPVDDVREGYLHKVEVAGVPIILVRSGDVVRAFDGTCTHAEFQFESSRLVRGCEIECPIHGARFSAVDGAVVKGPAKEPLEEIRCRIEGDQVLVAPDWI